MIQPAFNKYKCHFLLNCVFWGRRGAFQKDRYSKLCGTVFQRWNLVTNFETFFIVHFDLIRGECLRKWSRTEPPGGKTP